jgi:hypothetical protein
MFGWFKKRFSRPPGPDFSRIDSREKAEALFRQGELEMLYLLPPEFGGDDAPPNILFVPVGLGAVKAGIDQNVVAPLAAEGKLTRYTAMPEYQGSSVIPIAIRIEASDPGQFSTVINIWGDALTRDGSG